MFFIETLRAWARERGRAIFRYHDGASRRRADPIRLAAALERECPKYLDHLEALGANPAEALPGATRESIAAQQKTARDELVRAARAVFGMAPLTDTAGATDAEAFIVLANYLAFMEAAAEDAELFRRSPGAESASPPASRTEPSSASTTAAS